jgi:hypothetical protein
MIESSSELVWRDTMTRATTRLARTAVAAATLVLGLALSAGIAEAAGPVHAARGLSAAPDHGSALGGALFGIGLLACLLAVFAWALTTEHSGRPLHEAAATDDASSRLALGA